MKERIHLEKGILWWLSRITPFFLLYLVVKITFFLGYFEIFGDKQIQLMAHDFFIKVILTFCIIITLIALKRYFINFIELFIFSFTSKFSQTEDTKKGIAKIFSRFMLYFLFFFGGLTILNLWLTSQISWLTQVLTSSYILFLSFLAGLFTSGLLGNIIAYEILIKIREFKVGNRVKIDQIYGDIESIGLFFTHIRTIDNELINVPNLHILTKSVKNYSSFPNLMVSVFAYLPYSVNLEEVMDIFMKAASKTEGVLKSRKPVIWCAELGEMSMKYHVRVFIEDPKKRDQIKSDLLTNALIEIEKRKIKMPLPRRMKFDEKDEIK